jgi:hypothetical protein
MKANQKTKPVPTQPVKRPPETIEERVHRHISDINSKITDDDIRGVKTELDIRRNSANPPEKENKANKKQKKSVRPDKKAKQGNEQKQTTPWDLLSEGYE